MKELILVFLVSGLFCLFLSFLLSEIFESQELRIV